MRPPWGRVETWERLQVEPLHFTTPLNITVLNNQKVITLIHQHHVHKLEIHFIKLCKL